MGSTMAPLLPRRGASSTKKPFLSRVSPSVEVWIRSVITGMAPSALGTVVTLYLGIPAVRSLAGEGQGKPAKRVRTDQRWKAK